MEKRKKAVLFLGQYPEKVSPGQRFRFELYKDVLAEAGIQITSAPFLNQKGYSIIHQKGLLFSKGSHIFMGYCRRLLLLFAAGRFDYIFLYREAAPVGPPFIEWLLIKVLNKKVIYDFDDAIWIPHVSENNTRALALKNVGKIKTICKWAYKVSAGNEYLCNYAKQFSASVLYNPTCVDTERKHNIIANHDVDRITIGWTGSFSTLKYLELVLPVLEALQKKYDFDIKVICNQQPSFTIKNLQYVEWSEEKEVSELATCQIGLMPLTSDEWTEGKCGFKLVQYLSLGIPAVSSPVGVNPKIVDKDINGFFCNSFEEWYGAIEKLMLDTTLRKRMGEAGRKKIINQYSLQSNKENFLSLFN
ncbi:MAG TPA: glycosyltransferase [Ferruginibacter sp.]|nr:glycosyltransferase [Ferruginibacter sp.]HMP19694.1 glycosyltransferase [Ferruginibacter sp.]